MSHITQVQVLYRIDALLEQALRETVHIEKVHDLHLQIHRIRDVIKERVMYQRIEDKGELR